MVLTTKGSTNAPKENRPVPVLVSRRMYELIELARDKITPEDYLERVLRLHFEGALHEPEGLPATHKPD